MEQGPWSQSHTHRMLQHTGSSTPHLTHTESRWRAGPYAQHRWEDQTRAATAAEALPAELAPGDALLYSGKVLHGGGANTSATRWRHAVHLSFVVG
jgi:ectoine hydroxylase-related dioxygenase (phytanoyl-CoA dioxygenase family)